MNTTPVTAEEVEESAFRDEVGTVIFQSALLRFVAEAEPAVVAGFESYVSTHAEKEDFLVTLAASYPRFQELLTEEASLLEKEMKEYTDGVFAAP